MPFSIYRLALSLVITATAVLTAPQQSPDSLTTSTLPQARCRLLPGDSTWPKSHYWDGLNKTVNGHLISAVPMASVCHSAPYNSFNASECLSVQETWNRTTLDRCVFFISSIQLGVAFC